MRPLMILLVILLFSVQYQLWFGKNSLSDYSQVSTSVERQQVKNDELQKRNGVIEVEIKDLRSGYFGIEAVARNELGMIKKNETFYRIIPTDNK